MACVPTWQKKLQYKTFHIFHKRRNNNFHSRNCRKENILSAIFITARNNAENNDAFSFQCTETRNDKYVLISTEYNIIYRFLKCVMVFFILFSY